jgi:hypothetical protein
MSGSERFVIVGLGLLALAVMVAATSPFLMRTRARMLQLARVWQEVAERHGLVFKPPSWFNTLGGTDGGAPTLRGSKPVQGLEVTLVQRHSKSTHLSGIAVWLPEGTYLSVSRRPSGAGAGSLVGHGLTAEWSPAAFRSKLTDAFLDITLQELASLPTFSWCSIQGKDAYHDRPGCTLALDGLCGDATVLEHALTLLEKLCMAGPGTQ